MECLKSDRHVQCIQKFEIQPKHLQLEDQHQLQHSRNVQELSYQRKIQTKIE